MVCPLMQEILVTMLSAQVTMLLLAFVGNLVASNAMPLLVA